MYREVVVTKDPKAVILTPRNDNVQYAIRVY